MMLPAFAFLFSFACDVTDEDSSIVAYYKKRRNYLRLSFITRVQKNKLAAL